MTWQKLISDEELSDIQNLSKEKDVLIFKHSTRCSISATALARLERKWNDKQAGSMIPYYLDLLAHRPISNRIAELYGIEHQSPQVLLIRKGKCVYDASHLEIDFESICKQSS
jgi:bacillithiol system protein YtxJ